MFAASMTTASCGRCGRWSRDLRTNAFAPQAAEALAFKIEIKKVPGLPAPVPYREIWVYSPRVEGIHLRGGPIARGGLAGPTGATTSAPRSSA